MIAIIVFAAVSLVGGIGKCVVTDRTKLLGGSRCNQILEACR